MNGNRFGRRAVLVSLVLIALLAYAAIIWGAGRIDNRLASGGVGSETPAATAPQTTSPSDSDGESTDADVSSGIPSDAEEVSSPRTTPVDGADESTEAPQPTQPSPESPPATNEAADPDPAPAPTPAPPAQSSPEPSPDAGGGEKGSLADPLGTGAEPGSLSERDRRRVDMGASRYIETAYGFEGTDPDEYRMELFMTVVQPEYGKSPGGSLTDKLAGRVERSGFQGKADFKQFDVESEDPSRVKGVVSFTLDEGSGEDSYQQRLQLVPWGAAWKVIHAEKLQES